MTTSARSAPTRRAPASAPAPRSRVGGGASRQGRLRPALGAAATALPLARAPLPALQAVPRCSCPWPWPRAEGSEGEGGEAAPEGGKSAKRGGKERKERKAKGGCTHVRQQEHADCIPLRARTQRRPVTPIFRLPACLPCCRRRGSGRQGFHRGCRRQAVAHRAPAGAAAAPSPALASGGQPPHRPGATHTVVQSCGHCWPAAASGPGQLSDQAEPRRPRDACAWVPGEGMPAHLLCLGHRGKAQLQASAPLIRTPSALHAGRRSLHTSRTAPRARDGRPHRCHRPQHGAAGAAAACIAQRRCCHPHGAAWPGGCAPAAGCA